MNAIARLGFVLLGLHLAFGGLVAAFNLPGVAAEGHLLAGLRYLAIALGGALIFGVLPGAFFVVKNESLAGRLFPHNGPAPDSESIVVAAVAVAGAWLVLTSLISVFGGLAAILLMSSMEVGIGLGLKGLSRGAFGIVGGIFVYRYAERIVRSTWRRRGSASDAA